MNEIYADYAIEDIESGKYLSQDCCRKHLTFVDKRADAIQFNSKAQASRMLTALPKSQEHYKIIKTCDWM